MVFVSETKFDDHSNGTTTMCPLLEQFDVDPSNATRHNIQSGFQSPMRVMYDDEFTTLYDFRIVNL